MSSRPPSHPPAILALADGTVHFDYASKRSKRANIVPVTS